MELEFAESDRRLRQLAIGAAASQRYQEANRARSPLKTTRLTCEAQAFTQTVGISRPSPSPRKAGIGSIVIAVLVLLAIVGLLRGWLPRSLLAALFSR
jgi:hypothetical protein